jgi:hypothetical protein
MTMGTQFGGCQGLHTKDRMVVAKDHMAILNNQDVMANIHCAHYEEKKEFTMAKDHKFACCEICVQYRQRL